MNKQLLQTIDPIIQSIIDTLPVLLFWTDTDHIIMGNNVMHASFWGADKSDELVGLSMREMGKRQNLEKHLVDGWYNQHNNIMNSKQGEVVEYPNLYSPLSSKPRTFLSSKEPLFDENNNVIGLVGVAMDITELKNAQKDLAVEKEKAEKASAVKSEFIANMSHDIRTPITGIIGAVQELLNTAENTKIVLDAPETTKTSNKELASMLRNLAETIEHDGDLLLGSADQLLRLCNEVLETIRLDSGLANVPSEAFDIHQLILQNIELLQPIAQHRQLTLSADINPAIPQYVCGLRTYLDRTFLNLISNALKFTDQGHVKVSLILKDDKPQKKHEIGDIVTLQIAIEDTGAGIPNNKFEEVFDHFTRLTSSYEGNYKGSGLGLYTVKRYIEAMNGTIDLVSKVGIGTTFTLTLPFEVSDHSDRVHQSIRMPESLKSKRKAAKRLAKQSTSNNAQTDKNKVSVLIVEDNMAASMAIRVTLNTFDCIVDYAEDGKTAVEKAKANTYNLVLMDLGLPDFSGIEATKQIRALSDAKKSQVAIVALTGHASAETRNECLEASMQDVLIKPAKPLILQDVLHRYVIDIADETNEIDTTKQHTTQKSSLDVIDWETSLRMLSGDERIFKSVFTAFIEDLRLAQDRLAESMKTKDYESLRAELHRCLGGVVYFRLPQLEQALRNFQSAANTNPLKIQPMKKTYTALEHAIEAFWQVVEEAEF